MDFLTYGGIIFVIITILIIIVYVIIPSFTAAQVITDPGYPNSANHLTRGWYNVQNLSSPRDYCGYVGSGTQPSNWGCALAGKKGWSSQNPASPVFLAGPTGGSSMSGPI